MTTLVSPKRTDRSHPERQRYEWSSIALGVWQCWLDLNPDLPRDEARRQRDRVRLAGRDYARRHGLQMESRSQNHGHVLDLRFTRQGTAR